MAKGRERRPKRCPEAIGGELIVKWRWLLAWHDAMARDFAAAAERGDTEAADEIDAQLVDLVRALARLDRARNQLDELREIVASWPPKTRRWALVRAHRAVHRLLRDHPVDAVLAAIAAFLRRRAATDATLDLHATLVAIRDIRPLPTADTSSAKHLRKSIRSTDGYYPSERAARVVATLAGTDRASIYRAMALYRRPSSGTRTI